jgi:hypothetical protein
MRVIAAIGLVAFTAVGCAPVAGLLSAGRSLDCRSPLDAALCVELKNQSARAPYGQTPEQARNSPNEARASLQSAATAPPVEAHDPNDAKQQFGIKRQESAQSIPTIPTFCGRIDNTPEQIQTCNAAVWARVDAEVNERGRVLPLPEVCHMTVPLPPEHQRTCMAAMRQQDAAVERACSQGSLTQEQRSLLCSRALQ